MAEPLDGKLARAVPVASRDRARQREGARVRRGPDGRRPSTDDWEKCSGGVVVDVVAEGWGRARRASALGERRHDGHACGGRQRAGRTCGCRTLVESVRGASNADSWRPRRPRPTQPMRIARDAAESDPERAVVCHRAGTSRWRASRCSSARRARRWTGSRQDRDADVSQRRPLARTSLRACAPGVAQDAQRAAACGPLRRYKWYVAAYRTDRRDPRWTR
jgi:hypothetical protein